MRVCPSPLDFLVSLSDEYNLIPRSLDSLNLLSAPKLSLMLQNNLVYDKIACTFREIKFSEVSSLKYKYKTLYIHKLYEHIKINI